MISQINEEWKPINGYEGLYEVSNTGKVRSLNYNKTGKTKELSFETSRCGYHRVRLYNGKTKAFYVHRLVYYSFFPSDDRKLQVNHKDEDKTNNHIDNLELLTPKENNHYGTRIERCAKTQSIKMKGRPCHINTIKANSIPVVQYSLKGKKISVFSSTMEAERCTGIGHSQISKVCRKQEKYLTAGGYKWEYANHTPEHHLR